MYITTETITISPNTLFFIAVRRHFEEKKWQFVAYPLGLIGYIYLMSLSHGSFRYLGIIGFGLMLAVLLYILAYYWDRTHAPDSEKTFLSRFYVIDKFFIRTKVEDGSERSMRWDSIVKLTETAKYYLLYTSPTHFMYIAKNAFRSEADRKHFDHILQERGLTS